MESFRHTMDSELLSGVIPLPARFHNKKVELIVFLAEEKTSPPPRLTMAEIDAMLKGSVTESLIGTLSGADTTLDSHIPAIPPGDFLERVVTRD